MAYPIRIKLTAAVLEELGQCELGSWEDLNGEDRDPDEDLDSRPLASHTYAVVERSPRTVLIINNQAEAEDVYYAVCSGTFQLYHLHSARRIANILRPHALPETVKLWPAPTGY
jgi:hypothetical protein